MLSLGRTLILLLVAGIVAASSVGWFIFTRRQTEARISVDYPEGVAAVVPLGISAAKAPTISLSMANPLADDPNAIIEGRRLYTSMNCAGCHGYNAKGGMGPNLTDEDWRYGGLPIEVYKSIYEGRPKGMPAWGSALPPATIWNLVAYIQSLGGTFKVPPPGASPLASNVYPTGPPVSKP